MQFSPVMFLFSSGTPFCVALGSKSSFTSIDSCEHGRCTTISKSFLVYDNAVLREECRSDYQ